ncbi:hypothetical protein [Absidia glauca]|uniref:G-protein coupled receptors family 3 profile domain-containing protein n=1 Tax=Absidia glauca TaxID=4829 RepID=A0A168QT73_ABSGL|nr:hypothetical protein [Absidia glauca]
MADNGTISIFKHTIQLDPLNHITQPDNNTVLITPRYNTTGRTELKIGLLLPFSQTSDQFTETIVWGGSSAIRMAINEINAAQLIPGAYITLIQKDSFPDPSVDQAAVTNAVYALVTLLQQGVIGVIGDVTSSWTALSALMTSALNLPQCSFAASAVSFSDKVQFKYFFRTIPTDVVMIDAILQFVIREGWTKVGVIYTDDPLGQQLYQRAIQQTEALNIQLVSYQSYPSTTTTPTSVAMKDSLDNLITSGARIILVAARGQAQSSLMVQAAVSGYLTPNYVWLLVQDGFIYDMADSIADYNRQPGIPRPLSIESDFNGVFYFADWLKLDGYSPYDTFINKWSNLDTNVYPYAGSTNVTTYEGLAYSCMMVMADGFQTILGTKSNHTDGLLQLAQGNLDADLLPPAFNTGYVGPEGPMRLDSNGDVMSGNYRVMNYQHGTSVVVGQSLVGNLTITSPPMFYDGSFTTPSDSPPSTALNPGITSAVSFVIMIVAAIGSLFAIAVFGVVVLYRKNDIFKAASPLFCCLELIGFIFTYISVVMMIGTPSQVTCILMPLSFNFGFLLVISNMIAKNYRIYRIFNNVFISRTVITDLQLIKSVTFMVGLDMIILVIALIVLSPRPVKVDVSLTQYYWSCRAENPHQGVFVGVMCAYWAVLLLFATFLAYKTRLAGRQYSRYSECRQMGLSIYNIFFSALVAFAVLVNAMADYYTKYYISIVTVLWATTFSLLILFLPKLQAFIQQQRELKAKKDTSEKISASQLVMAAAVATVGFGTNDPSYQKQQHFMDPSDATELLSLGEILGSDAPVFRPTMDNNKGRNHGSFVEVYEADIPARKVFRYFPFLSHWEMLHIMVFPWLGYFTYISKCAKQGQVMAYHHATIHTAALENYVLTIHGQGVYDMHIQVPDLKTLELWETRLNQRYQVDEPGSNVHGSSDS